MYVKPHKSFLSFGTTQNSFSDSPVPRAELLPGAARQGADDPRALHLHEGVEDDLPLHRHQHQGQGDVPPMSIGLRTPAAATAAVRIALGDDIDMNC